MEEYSTHSRGETVALGRSLAARLYPGALITFTGGLGTGKTALCQGIAEGLGCTIHTEGDLAAAGFYDYLDLGAVVAVEWSENCAELLARESPIAIDIQRTGENDRRITVTGL